VISGTGLIQMADDAGLTQPTTGHSRFLHLHLILIFQHHKASLTPSEAVYERALQGVSLSIVSSVYGFFFLQFLKVPECRTVHHPASQVPK
jgi:hypothetical protein